MVSDRIKKFIILAFILALLGWLYFYISGSDKSVGSSGNLLMQQSATNTAAIGASEQEILSLLRRLKSISLQTELFESNAFRSLEDFGVTLEPQPIGRSNPFAPIGIQSPLPDTFIESTQDAPAVIQEETSTSTDTTTESGSQ